MDVKRLPGGSVLYADGQGVMQSHHLCPGLLLHVRRGVMTVDFARPVIADMERHLREVGRCVLMVDGYEVKRHTTEFRDVMTEWFQHHEQATVHMLLRSSMLEMALNVANLVMGATRAHTYYDVADWEAVGQRELPSFGRRPLAVGADGDEG